jgi:hypothetical protein
VPAAEAMTPRKQGRHSHSPPGTQLPLFAPSVIVSRWPAWIPLTIGVETAARAYAEELRALWCSSGPEPLGNAYRLLDVDNLAKVVLSAMAASCLGIRPFPPADASGRFYAFPSWRLLQSWLRRWIWDSLLEGRLVASGIGSDDLLKGKRFSIPVDRLHLLEPDWDEATLRAHGHVYVCDVTVLAPVSTVTRGLRRSVSEAALRRCVEGIAKRWPRQQDPPSEEQLQTLVEAELGWVARDRVRAARPSEWVRERGRPRKNKSPK